MLAENAAIGLAIGPSRLRCPILRIVLSDYRYRMVRY